MQYILRFYMQLWKVLVNKKKTMKTHKFQLGDLVRHKTGGPIMIIRDIDENTGERYGCNFVKPKSSHIGIENDNSTFEFESFFEFELRKVNKKV